MNAKLFLLYVLMCVLLSCKMSKENVSPLSSQQMTNLLADIFRATNYTDTAFLKINNKDSASAIVLHRVLQKHHITDTNFKLSYAYYLSTPDSLISLLKQVQQQLQKK